MDKPCNFLDKITKAWTILTQTTSESNQSFYRKRTKVGQIHPEKKDYLTRYRIKLQIVLMTDSFLHVMQKMNSYTVIASKNMTITSCL